VSVGADRRVRSVSNAANVEKGGHAGPPLQNDAARLFCNVLHRSDDTSAALREISFDKLRTGSRQARNDEGVVRWRTADLAAPFFVNEALDILTVREVIA
jgi:hypothetical protein